MLSPRAYVVPVLAALLATSAGCAASRPPFSHPATPYAPAPEQQANVVFLWPETSCDPAGYLIVTTTDGRFVATISRGMQTWAHLPAGHQSLVAWNEVLDQETGVLHRDTTAALHAELADGHTYYALVSFGDWDARGPRERWAQNRRSAWRVCTVGSRDATTLALLTVSPATPQWASLPEWVDSLAPLQPSVPEGQAWVDANRSSLAIHAAAAEDRFASLRPGAPRLATIEPDDGVGR